MNLKEMYMDVQVVIPPERIKKIINHTHEEIKQLQVDLDNKANSLLYLGEIYRQLSVKYQTLDLLTFGKNLKYRIQAKAFYLKSQKIMDFIEYCEADYSDNEQEMPEFLDNNELLNKCNLDNSKNMDETLYSCENDIDCENDSEQADKSISNEKMENLKAHSLLNDLDVIKKMAKYLCDEFEAHLKNKIRE